MGRSWGSDTASAEQVLRQPRCPSELDAPEPKHSSHAAAKYSHGWRPRRLLEACGTAGSRGVSGMLSWNSNKRDDPGPDSAAPCVDHRTAPCRLRRCCQAPHARLRSCGLGSTPAAPLTAPWLACVSYATHHSNCDDSRTDQRV
jgi:hypothetical protein